MPRSANALLIFGLALSLGALCAFAALQYRLPHELAVESSMNERGVHQFASHLGVGVTPLSSGRFAHDYRLLLLIVWVGYACSVVAGGKGARLASKPLCLLVAITCALFAVAYPPSESTDVYAYAASARLPVLYGLNPYSHAPLFALPPGDSTRSYLHWNIPSVYGPVWTLLSMAMVGLLRGGGLWAQIVALKVIESVALLGGALAARRIAEHFEPGSGNLTLLAVGLNPLLLIEGPGNGHNDILMMSLLLVGAALLHRGTGRADRAAWLVFGLSVGIKWLTLAALPWILWERCRGMTSRAGLKTAAARLGLVLLPVLLCYLPLWQGAATFDAFRDRAAYHAPAASPLAFLPHWPWALPFAFAGLSVWLTTRRAEGDRLIAWTIFAGATGFLALGQAFPWYLAWLWMPILTRWNHMHLILALLCFSVSLWIGLS